MKGEKRASEVGVGHPQEPGHGPGQLGGWKEEQGGSEGAVQVSARPPPDEHHRFPPPAITTQKSCLRGRVGSKACFDRRGKQEKEREALTRAGMC